MIFSLPTIAGTIQGESSLGLSMVAGKALTILKSVMTRGNLEILLRVEQLKEYARCRARSKTFTTWNTPDIAL